MRGCPNQYLFMNRSRQTSRLRCMISWIWCINIKYCTWFPTSEIIIIIHKETKCGRPCFILAVVISLLSSVHMYIYIWYNIDGW
jgi:hypothetical protein